MPANNITVYVYYSPNSYKISYAYTSDSAKPSGVTLPTAQTVTYGSSYKLSSVQSATGYTVKGWLSTNSSSGSNAATSGTMPANNFTVYVYYKPIDYTISYAYASGSAQPVTLPSSQTVTYGTSYTLSSVPSATGYTVRAWISTSDSDGTLASNSGTMPANNFTVYAYYQLDPPNPQKGFDGSSSTTSKSLDDRNSQFTFSVFQTLPAAGTAFLPTTVTMSDTLNECIEFVSGKAYVDGSEVTADFSYSGNTVTCTLNGATAGNGEAASIRWDLTCKIKDRADLSAYASSDDPAWSILQNTASVDVLRVDGGDFNRTTNTVDLKVYTPCVNLTLKKTNSVTGENIADAEFTVYEWDGSGYNTLVGKMTYRAKVANYYIENLYRTETNQGKYKIIETVTPTGFVGTYETEITVSSEAEAAGTDMTLDATNDMPTGTIVVTKKAKGSEELLEGGTYQITTVEDIVSPGGQVLVEKDTVVDTITTTNEGVATSVNLYPGTYLVTETKAPTGYALDADPQEVTIVYVDKDTATKEYPLTFVNDRLYADITITKILDAEDIVWAHGNPTFTFELTGTDVLNESHTYYGTVEFTSSNTTATSGKVTVSTTVRVLAGSYTATEDKTMRYELSSVSDVQNGTVSGKTAVLDVSSGQDAAASFYNVKVNDEDCGHTAFVSNHIG